MKHEVFGETVAPHGPQPLLAKILQKLTKIGLTAIAPRIEHLGKIDRLLEGRKSRR